MSTDIERPPDPQERDLKPFLWALKLGAFVNLYFLGRTVVPPLTAVDASLLRPAQILFVVSAFRCLFPVRYRNNVVLHDSPFSSIFITRLLATFSEVALIYQLAFVLRLLNVGQVEWVVWVSGGMVLMVLVSQCFVWGAILTGRRTLFYYEEVGWGLIFAANTLASVYLFWGFENAGGNERLLQVNLLFGAVYLPWQLVHLRALRDDARQREREEEQEADVTWHTLANGLRRSIRVKSQTSRSAAWGGLLGVTWMTGYWATLIPLWAYQIVRLAGR